LAPVNLPTPLNQVRPYQPDAPIAAPSEIPLSTPPPAPNIPSGRFTIQVGSFQDERQAQELANRLRRNGFASYISRTHIQGVGSRMRVRVGGFDSKEKAEEVAFSLRSRQHVSAFVTRND
jgi:cell division septation protein DedD